MNSPIEVAAFDAKTRLPELLRGVERGQEYLITRHGRPVARLTPVVPEVKARPVDAVVADLRTLAARLDTSLDEILAWRDEGRR